LVPLGKTKLSIILITVSLIVLMVAAIPANAQTGLWRDINPDAYLSPPANPQLNSLYMLSANEGWAVGDSLPSINTVTALPAIFHYDGTTWNLVPAPKFQSFCGPLVCKQHAYNLTSVTFGPPNNPISRNDGWAVGFNDTFPSPTPPILFANANASVAIHWDGVSWRLETAGLSGNNAGQLWSAFMVSSTDVWAVGQVQSTSAGSTCAISPGSTCGVFWHWTGVPGLGGGWNTPQAPVKNTVFYSVFMVNANEGWAVGCTGVAGACLPGGTGAGAIFHYFGGTWSAFAAPTTPTLRSVFMLSPTEGWAVGDSGTIIHYSNGIWSGPVSPGTTLNNLYSIFMVSSTEGWAFGKAGSILHYSGGSWTLLPSNLVPTSPVVGLNFNSGYFNTAADGWSVGTDGVILHFDGSNYGTVTSPTINNFTSISFGPPLTGPINPNDGWAVGNASVPTLISSITSTTTTTTISPSLEPTIYHWNGFMWTKGVAIGAQNNLNSVFMVNGGDVWTVGGGSHATSSCSGPLCPIILHFTGGSWNTVTPPSGVYELNSVFMVSSTEGWAVGEQVGSPTPVCSGLTPNCAGIILHYTVTGGVGTWAIFPAPTIPPSTPIPGLNSVFMLNQNEGWAVGNNATIIHYTVTGGTGTWNVVTVSGSPGLSADANLTSVFMLSPTSGWAVGGISVSGITDGPVIIYWDGTKWSPVAVPSIPGGITATGHTSGMLKSVFFEAPDDGWAVGYPGTLVANILHWNGFAWSHVTMSPALLGQIPPILTSVYMTSENDGWIVGATPDFTNTPPNNVAPTQYWSGPGFKQPLSTILRFGPFGGVATVTTVSTVSQVSSGTVTTTATTTVTTTPTTIQSNIKVVDTQNNPVSGATVAIPSLGLSAVTGSNGIVTFNVIPGTYNVTVTRAGTTTTVSISPNSNGQTFTITLAGGAGIPGFPSESIAAGLFLGIVALLLVRRKRRSRV
jgi:photosystem II stability/assembly factor-like uncharacterized protein